MDRLWCCHCQRNSQSRFIYGDDDGMPIVKIRNYQFPVIIRNVATTITQVPNLGNANSNTGLNEGQTLTVSAGTISGGTLRYNVLANGTVVDTLIVSDPSATDRTNLVTRFSITDSEGQTTDLTQSSLTLGASNGAYVSTGLVVDQSASTGGATFEMWLRPTASSGTRYVFDTVGTGNRGWALLHNGTNWLIDNGSSTFTTTLTVTSGQWQHIAVVFHPTNGVTVYKRMDGSATVESSSSATIGFTTMVDR